VSVDIVLDAPVVSVVLASFFAHAVSATAAIAIVPTVSLDPFFHIVLLLPSPSQGQEKNRTNDEAAFFVCRGFRQ
jgi:hypothetical protein